MKPELKMNRQRFYVWMYYLIFSYAYERASRGRFTVRYGAKRVDELIDMYPRAA